ncbi:MAG: AAA family ATPase [Candidatus Sericytochromatia bacterium]|nr:AAA family ATPase [Candidatus Sericytochromatia bacterium]
MFKILRLSFSNWDCWRPVSVPLDEPIVMLAGPNGSGKTTFLDGIRIILNAPRLSTKRRRNKYMRDKRQMTVVSALVSNYESEVGRPFRCLNILEDHVTLACVLVPAAGSVESRYVILPGDAPFSDIQAAYAQNKLYGPGEYSDILFKAGVSRSLLSILAIEQGETNKLCERTPQELFTYVMQIKGQRQVFDRYQEAKDSYHKALADLDEQTKRLGVEQATLEKLERQKREFDLFTDRHRQVGHYRTTLLPLAEYKDVLGDLKRLGPDLENGQQRLEALKADREALKAFHAREIEGKARLTAELTDARARGQAMDHDRKAAMGEGRDMDLALGRLEGVRQVAERVLEEDMEALEADVAVAEEALGDARARLNRVEEQRKELLGVLASLQKGQVVYPPFVDGMRETLRAADIPATLVAEALEVTDPHWQVAVESVVGGDRFNWIVTPQHHVAALELARRNRYRHYMCEPSREPALTARAGSALAAVKVLDPRVPRWILERLNDTALVDDVQAAKAAIGRFQAAITADGYKVDRRGGIFVGVRPGECFLGQLGVSARAEEGLKRLEELEEEAREIKRDMQLYTRELAERRQAVADQTKRQEWEALRPEYDSITARREAWQARITELEQALSAAQEEIIQKAQAAANADRDASQAEHDMARLQRELDALQAQLASRGPQLAALEATRRRLEDAIPAGARTPEALASVPLPDVVRLRINEMESELARYAGCTDAAIVTLWEKQAENVQAQETFVTRRLREVNEGETELKACRMSYIRLVEQVLGDYRENALRLAEKANIRLHMELPTFSPEDDGIEKAGVHVQVAYDGKDLRPLSDPDLSGGQKVIVSLLLLMALTDGDGGAGPGFFILDEPFAHLSVERIDEVGDFLKASSAQFILTTPTTHNHNVFNPARLTITLFKKPHHENLAPPPVVCRV